MKSIILSIVFVTVFGSIAAHFKDHANQIYIGAALAIGHLQEDTQYQTIAQEEFNCMTCENEMKWDATEPSQGSVSYASADALVAFAKQNGMKIRGHTLVWHSQVPSWVSGLSGDALLQAMHNHITDEVTHFGSDIYAWDVVNEVLNEDGTLRSSLWSQNFGQDFIADAFKTAAAASTSAKLYINDYNIEGINAKSTGLYNLVKDLLSQGVPIHGVGFQAHLQSGSVATDLQANLQRFAELGVDVAITELDIKSYDATQQAQDYANVIKACLAVSRCVGVTMWGITDKYSWITDGSPLPWDSNYQAKAAVAAIEAALQ